jgi:VWFA-related protein
MTRQASIVTAALLILQPPAFHTGVEVVTVDVSVTRGDAPVAGLTADDFVVTDNGVRQQVDSATAEQRPLSVTLILDTSVSVSGERLDSLIAASDQALTELRPTDSVSLITFSSRVARPVAPTHDFDSMRAALHGITGHGHTAMRDAVFLALHAAPHDATRPLLLVFTDGLDTTSWISEADLLEAVRRANVVVHAVTVPPSLRFLAQMTHEAGGRTWSASSNRDLQTLFGRAIRDMRDRYVLSFRPSGVARPGWHALHVTLKQRRANVIARPGYWDSSR